MTQVHISAESSETNQLRNNQFQTRTQQILIIRGQKWIISLSLFVITSVNQAELKGLIQLSNNMYVLYLLASWHLLRSFGHKFWHYETQLRLYYNHIILSRHISSKYSGGSLSSSLSLCDIYYSLYLGHLRKRQ